MSPDDGAISAEFAALLAVIQEVLDQFLPLDEIDAGLRRLLAEESGELTEDAADTSGYLAQSEIDAVLAQRSPDATEAGLRRVLDAVAGQDSARPPTTEESS